MLKTLLPPLCLVLALALAVTGFSMIALGPPEASVSLHQARAERDELATAKLEGDLEERQFSRTVLITAMFVGSGVMTLVAFGAMGERK